MTSVRDTTEPGVANVALGWLGQPTIASLTDTSLRARAMNQFFAVTRDAVLRAGWWNFAKRWATPAADPVASKGPLTIRYILPTDCLRVRFVRCIGSTEWGEESAQVGVAGAQVEAMVLVTNQTAPVVCYTGLVDNVRMWDPDFYDAFALLLAAAAARKLGRSRALAADLREQGEKKIMDAKGVDSKEDADNENERPMSDWLYARRVGGSRRIYRTPNRPPWY